MATTTTTTTESSAIDLLIEARWVIPVEPAGACLEDHAVAVRDGHIVDVLATTDAHVRYSAAQTVELRDHALIPGLVNLHGHTAMSLLRGFADDLPLQRWLTEAIWPAERAHLSDEFVFDGCLLGAAEMLQGGITTVNDMYFFPEGAARAFDEAGMRAIIGLTVIDFPTAFAADANSHLQKGLAVRDVWREHPRIGFALAPHAPYTVSDATFEQVLSIAEELDCLIHLHVHETAQEIEDGLKAHGIRPFDRLKRLGLLGPNLIAVHAVHMNELEIAEMAAHGVSVAHNPTSNMKLASGAAPIHQMQGAGVNVGLGTDGAASNNRLDLFQEMRHAALLAKVISGDASVMSAVDVLRMATLNGAKALGLDHLLGSIEVGKAADLCAVDLSAIEHQPCFDPISHLVYVAGREAVTDVWVSGKQLIKAKEFSALHQKDVRRRAAAWHNSLRR